MNGTFEVDLLSTGLKTAGMLLIVLALLIGVLYIMKRFSFFHRESGDGVLIKVLSTKHLSPKERIEVLEISGEKIVVGISANNMTFLTKLKDGNNSSATKSRSHEDGI